MLPFGKHFHSFSKSKKVISVLLLKLLLNRETNFRQV